MDADVFISLTHFKGHEMTGFGGAIKNIGMGCGSRAGKTEQSTDPEPHILPLRSVVAANAVSVNVPTVDWYLMKQEKKNDGRYRTLCRMWTLSWSLQL